MRTLDYAPLFRSTVRFDQLFDLVDSGTRPDWPPYNIEKHGENQYQISMAVAGFRPEEIELVQEANNLTVSGAKHTERETSHLLKLLTAEPRKDRSDDDDDPPPCPAVISPLPRLPPFGMQAELEAA
jgi:HSP20 family molecular chaperone IbpA